MLLVALGDHIVTDWLTLVIVLNCVALRVSGFQISSAVIKGVYWHWAINWGCWRTAAADGLSPAAVSLQLRERRLGIHCHRQTRLCTGLRGEQKAIFIAGGELSGGSLICFVLLSAKGPVALSPGRQRRRCWVNDIRKNQKVAREHVYYINTIMCICNKSWLVFPVISCPAFLSWVMAVIFIVKIMSKNFLVYRFNDVNKIGELLSSGSMITSAPGLVTFFSI